MRAIRHLAGPVVLAGLLGPGLLSAGVPRAWAGERDGISLRVTRGAGGSVDLAWSGGRPGFEVFRGTVPAGLTASPAARIAATRERQLSDAPPAAPIVFYEVGPRWPQFFSSDPAHDDLLNDLFVRHARAEYAADSLKRPDAASPAWGTVALWRDWEVDELLWHDYGALNYPLEDRRWFFAWFTQAFAVDRFGYAFSGGSGPEPATAGANCCFHAGWPFPSYADSRGLSAGWEWNGLNQEGWTLVNARSDGVADGEWRASTTKRDPQVVSPVLGVDAFQAPFVDLEIQYDAIDPFASTAERRWRFWWQTADDPSWTLDKSVTSDAFPLLPVAPLAGGVGLATAHLPMHLHPRWSGRTITRVRLDPLESESARTARWRLNFLRLDYDTRMSINNPILVRAVARKFLWDGDAAYLGQQLTRLRQATQFMLTHLRGAELGFLDHGWFVGHDGMGFAGPDQPRVGHGIQNNWFDLVSTGPRDLEAAVRYYLALQAMAEVEAYVEAHPEIDQPRPSVSGPDGTATIPYLETAASLLARIEPSRQAIHAEFWNAATGRYAGWRRADGTLADYGAVFANLEALAAGIPGPDEARAVLDWLDGRRVVPGDASQGADLYANGFAVRMNARKNDFDWLWGWAGWTVPFPDQVEDGGSSLHAAFFDVQARLRYGDAAGAWVAWTRMLDHHRTVRAFGGSGADFYRAYYAAHPGLGALQGCGVPGALGLDCEFVENLLAPAAWPVAWLGIATREDGLLTIAPTLPPGLTEAGVRSVAWHGHRLDVAHEAGAIDLRGSTLAEGAAGTLELVFRGAWPAGARVLRDGAPAPGEPTWAPDRLTLRTPLAAARFTVE
jgi:hypothetical protein